MTSDDDLQPDPLIELVPVFRSGDAALIAVAKSLLDAEGIEYLVRAEPVQNLFGLGVLGAGYNVITGPAEFSVREEDASRARGLLEPLLDSRTSLAEDDDPGDAVS
jgi:hypothetical protein